MPPVVGVLALQGAFREHALMLAGLGAKIREVRQPKDLDGLEAMVLPGGESTTIGKLLMELDMLDRLSGLVNEGMPVFGTCAGLILLSKEIENSQQPRLGLLDVHCRRNAYGRQVDSFEVDLSIPVLGEQPFPAVFIRAPVILETGADVEILARRPEDNQPVAVRQGSILAMSFHPELAKDTRAHEYFLKMI